MAPLDGPVEAPPGLIDVDRTRATGPPGLQDDDWQQRPAPSGRSGPSSKYPTESRSAAAGRSAMAAQNSHLGPGQQFWSQPNQGQPNWGEGSHANFQQQQMAGMSPGNWLSPGSGGKGFPGYSGWPAGMPAGRMPMSGPGAPYPNMMGNPCMGGMGGMGMGMQAPSPCGPRSSAAAAIALQKFAAAANAEVNGLVPSSAGYDSLEESLRRRVSAEDAAKATAARLKNASAAAAKAIVREEVQEQTETVGLAGSDTRYFGTIKAFSTVQGFGFIQCAEILRIYGCDCFLNQEVQGGIQIGGTVSFDVEVSNSGKPQARNVVLEESKPKTSAAGLISGAGAKDLVGKVYIGRVKSFNSSRGFGFIACKELQHSFGGRDIYVGRSQAPDDRLMVGQEYEFHLSVDRQGQPQASQLEPTAAGAVAPRFDLGPARPGPGTVVPLNSSGFNLFN